jgi:acyl carrier protein
MTEQSTVVTEAEVVELIRARLAEIAPEVDGGAAVSLDAEIADLGIDSMRTMELIADLEDELGIRFPDDELTQIASVRDLVTVVKRHAAARRR